MTERPEAPTRVRDDDGRVLPYDRARLAASVGRAQAEAGDTDTGFADEVAAIVTLALARGDVPGLPRRAGRGAGEVTLDSIGELVERALVELGRAPVARAYIVARARRNAARDALRGGAPRADDGRLPDVRGASGTEPWNPARIVAALVEEASLPRERAHEVAQRVEARVSGAGLKRLSTGLVRELVSNELLSLGLDRALRAHEALGVPRYDLRRLHTEARARRPGGAGGGLHAERGAGALPYTSFEERVAGEVLRRHALEDLLPEAAAERHRVGDHHLLDLDRPHRVLWRSLPADLLLRRELRGSAAHEVALDAATLASECASGLVLEELGRVVPQAARTTRHDGALREVLLALAAGAEGARRAIDLARPVVRVPGQGGAGQRPGPFVARLLGALDGLLVDGLAAPRLHLSLEELEAVGDEALAPEGALAPAVERLLAAGRLVPVWHGAEGAFTAPGCLRRAGDRAPLALGAAVALNLPRLARRAGPWREEALLALVADAARAGIEGLVALDAVQREARRVQGEPLRERVTYGVTLVGLDEALRILGDGAVRPAQGARVLGLLADAVARFARTRGIGVQVTPLATDDVAARFAELDATAKRAHQHRLFADLPRPEDERSSRYATGYDLPSLAAATLAPPGDPSEAPRRGSFGATATSERARVLGAGLAELFGTLPAGALVPFAPGLALDGHRLAVWRAFEARRRAFSAGPEGVRPGTLF